MAIKVQTPLTKDALKSLKAGDSCLISGVIYTYMEVQFIR